MQTLHRVHDLHALPMVKAGGGLVQDDDGRRHHDDGSQGKKLAGTTIEQEGLRIGVEVELHDHAVHTAAGFVIQAALRHEAELQLLPHGLAADLSVGVLEQKAHPAGKFAGAQVRGGNPVYQHLAAGRLQQAVAQTHGGGLSRAVGSHKGHEVAVLDGEAHVLENGGLRLVVGKDVLELDHAITSWHRETAWSTVRHTGPSKSPC